MKKIVTWIVLADGAHARFFANDGPGRGIKALAGLDLDETIPPGRDIVSDRAGRSFDSAGPGRSAMEPQTDPREEAKRRFLDRVAARLAEKAREGAFDRLVVAAPPRPLGELRAALAAPVKERLHAELAKDLTKVPVAELPVHLADVLPV
ncbi:MAG: host attachment protein [Alphaproteobacteria bacterium]|nr:host attachment protein [Alphaproteobacteria bacterium]